MNKGEEEYLNLYLTHRPPQDEAGFRVIGDTPEEARQTLELYVWYSIGVHVVQQSPEEQEVTGLGKSVKTSQKRGT